MTDKMQYTINIRIREIFDVILFFHRRKIYRYLNNLSTQYNKDGRLILEIGAGHKPNRHFFNNAKFIATDVKKYKEIDEIADATQLQYKDSTFDLVICIDVLEHIPYPQKAADEIHRVLKEEGKLFIVTPFLFPLHDVPFDYYRYTESSLRLIFQKFKNMFIDSILLFPLRGLLLERLVLYYICIMEK